jgi:dipeptidyl-peptidase-4
MHRELRLVAILCIAGGAGIAVAARAQTPGTLSIEAIYEPERREDFNGAPASGLRWIDRSTYLQANRSGSGVEWQKVDAATGTTSLLFDPARMEAALASVSPGSKLSAAAAARTSDLLLNPARTGALVSIDGDLYFYDFAAVSALRLTSSPDEEEDPTFSPDGRRVAFIRGNNLYAMDLASRNEVALTSDGNNQLLNGKLDWLYQEEIYGRGQFRGYWWSPDSDRLAFLQLDERPVPEYTIVDDITYRPRVEVTDYPKAGDPNPLVKLGVVRASGGPLTWMQIDGYSPDDLLVVDVDWTPDSAHVAFQVQDREQRRLDLLLAEPASGQSMRVLRETTPAWVNVNGSPVWLDDGTFLWFSERSGFKHLYRYRRDGTLIGPVTAGEWDVRTLFGVDNARQLVYFSAGATRHIDTDIYRIGLDGRNQTRVSRTAGTHRAIFNPDFSTYIDMWSDAGTPTQVRLHAADGTELRVIDANPVPSLREYRLATPEFVEVRARDGFVMDAMMIKPPDFSPNRRYPVYQFTYAGPGTSLVRNSWGGTTFMYHQLLAQQGVIVWVLDNRSAGGKGVRSQWPVYERLGELELQDLEDGVSWLERQPYVDASRIVLHGWSYGGFMTAYALTHSTRWSAGIAGAPVTDWRNYDTVYTERYMRTPQHNADGYRRTAPRFAAAGLNGRFLLIHGGIDDNVHRQNSEQLAYELQRAGRPFEMMIYPRSRHGVTDARLNLHLRRLMFDFIMETVRDTSLPAARRSNASAPGAAR